jgi:predicted HTH transcriptional regulator
LKKPFVSHDTSGFSSLVVSQIPSLKFSAFSFGLGISGQILVLLHEHGRLMTREIENMTQANRNTLKKYLAELVSQGQITRHGKGKATWYTLS